MRRLARTLVVVALLAAVAVGCTGSGSKKSSANEFVDAACSDLAAWAASVNSAFTDLQDVGQFDVTNVAGAQELLRRLSTALGDADKATSKLASGISSRGAPNISSGEDIKKSILDSLNRLRDLLSTTRTEVDNFDVQTATQAESDKLKSDLDGLSSGVADAFAGLAPLNENNDLKSAFEGSATCKQVGSDLSS
ncbi:MAG: hypothetical protein QOI95_2324 [Acidimicrobiaceae bacterium]|jgi:hypothetical protein